MTDQEYCESASKTESLPTKEIQERFHDPKMQRALHMIIGACTEIGELQDGFKKYLFYGKELDITNVEEELGDTMWYLAGLCNVLNLDLEKIKEKNIRKLKTRYPEKFNSEQALFRNLESERKELES